MNCKDEFIEHVGDRVVKCAIIKYAPNWDEADNRVFMLRVNYNLPDWDEFLACLNFIYDAGYGTQHITGTVWYADGTWSERGEYDGSEWWEYQCVPEVPKELQ